MHQEFFVSNRRRLIENLKDNSMLILFAGEAPHKSADAVYPFTPNRNFFYLTGIAKEHIIFMVTKKNGTVDEALFVERPDPIAEKWTGKKLTTSEASSISGVETTHFVDEFQTQLNRLLLKGTYDTLYLDFEQRSWASPASNVHRFADDVHHKYPFIQMHNIYPTICELRTIKSGEEIQYIQTAIDITNRGIQNMMRHARAGVNEYELEAHFDFVLRASGVKDHAFGSIVAGGKNATVLHYEDNDSVVEDNELVLLDLGAQYRYYNGDISRTFPVNGRFTERQKQLYNIVLKAMTETMNVIKAGIPFAKLNETTKRVLAEELKQIGMIQEDSEISKYYYHGVSHHLGLDTHDVGNYDGSILQPGMVLTVEPGLYIAEERIGIRIEDNVLVTEDGYKNLSENIIKTVDEIEAFMAANQ